MDESISSSFETVVAEKVRKVEFEQIESKLYGPGDEVKLNFRFPNESIMPSYLDVIRVVPLKSANEKKSPNEVSFSYCHWLVESRAGQFSVTFKVDAILELNNLIPKEGVEYVAQYVTLAQDGKAAAESCPFTIYSVKYDSISDIPGIFNDDGLVVLSGSDSEIEILDDERELEVAESKVGSLESGDGEELSIVMSEMELRKIENENKATNEKLRSFIDQYRADLLELTRYNETLKQQLFEEKCKVGNLEKTKNTLQREIAEVRKLCLREKTVIQGGLLERDRQFREELKKSAKLEEEVSLLTGHVENLRCCVDAHLETKNLLMLEIEHLRKEREEHLKKERDYKIKLEKEYHLNMQREEQLRQQIAKISEKATETGEFIDTQSPVIDFDEKVQELINKLHAAKVDSQIKCRKAFTDEIEKLQAANAQLSDELRELKNLKKCDQQTQTGESKQLTNDERIQDLVKRLQDAKIEYISLYKENKRKEKALENICNWAALAKDGMSLEAPAPSSITQAPSLITMTKEKSTADEFEDTSALNLKKPSYNFSEAPSLVSSVENCFTTLDKYKEYSTENNNGRDQPEEDLIELGSENRLALPPRQKRKIDCVRRSSAASTASASSNNAVRAIQRGKMVVRGRHRAQESFRNLQLKRDIASLDQEQTNPPANLLFPNTVHNRQQRIKLVLRKKDNPPRPSAPEDSSAVEGGPFDANSSKPLNLSTGDAAVPRGTNTYSAAGLISDLETDASNTEEETSVNNPNVCPLCVTSILDYEAHMREAHQKQPCPICGYVFDTNIPLYVMTYHIERHLDEVLDGPSTQ